MTSLPSRDYLRAVGARCSLGGFAPHSLTGLPSRHRRSVFPGGALPLTPSRDYLRAIGARCSLLGVASQKTKSGMLCRKSQYPEKTNKLVFPGYFLLYAGYPALLVFCGGERGIRTPGPSQANGFQDRRIRPLCHLSSSETDAKIRKNLV